MSNDIVSIIRRNNDVSIIDNNIYSIHKILRFSTQELYKIIKIIEELAVNYEKNIILKEENTKLKEEYDELKQNIQLENKYRN